MTKLELKEGNVGNCWKCGKQIFVRMTKGNDKYPQKLQRQELIVNTNPPQYQSHYTFNRETNETSCRGVVVTNADQEVLKAGGQIITEPPKVRELDMNDLTVKAYQKRFDFDMADFEMYEIMIYKKYGDKINPAKVGMIIKFLEERQRDRAK